MNPIEQKMIEWLEKGKWHPCLKPTDHEMEVSRLLNDIISDIQDRLKENSEN